MKRKVIGLVALAGLIISVTTGCIVRGDYGDYGYRHHHRYHDHDRGEYYRYHHGYDDH
jgi:hypothetical protein